MNGSVPYQSKSEEAEQLRHRAVNLYLEGESVSEIVRQTGRSRQWFYNTMNRYRSEGREGLASRSRVPHRVHNRTPAEIEAATVRIRETILSGRDPILRYAGVGARIIRSELERMGVTAPSLRTINRILKRNGIQSPRQCQRERKLPKDYPWPQAEEANGLHLFDFVTRVTQGGARYYGYHLLDQGRRWPYLEAHPSKNSPLVSQFLVNVWQTLGLPQAMQMDNDIVWRGSSSGARTFSHIVRLCLLVGIEVIFTPTYTPEANPIIESFNGVWASNFWQRQIFRDLKHVQQELPYFQTYYRHRHPLAEFDERKAVELTPDFQPVCVSEDFTQHQQARIPLTAGLIHYIRFADAQATFRILNESWTLPDMWANKTIRATIDTNKEQLLVYHQESAQHGPKLVHSWRYPVGEAVQPLGPVFVRPKNQFWPVPSHSIDC